MLQIQEQRKMGGEKFHVKKGSLTFSADPVSLTVKPGEVREDSFTIYGPDGKSAAGFVVSSELPVKVLTPSFEGAREVISWRFDGSAFHAGEELEGVFRILSDAGEYELPFEIHVQEEELESSLGPIRNLVHFTNLARVNWQEAVRLFYRPEFAGIVAREEAAANHSHSRKNRRAASAGSGQQEVPAAEKDQARQGYNYNEKASGNLLTLYRGLSVREGNEHNVEEFLIATGGKQPAEFTADVKEIRMDLPPQQKGLIQKKIQIRRSGWGYTSVGIEVSGDFLSVGTLHIGAASGQRGGQNVSYDNGNTGDIAASGRNRQIRGEANPAAGSLVVADPDFHDGAASVTILLDTEQMHGGRNFGHVILTPAYGRPIVIPVIVSYGINTAIQIMRRKEEKQVILQMMQEYIALRGGKTSSKEFSAQMAGLIRRLGDIDRNNPRTDLYRIHYMVTVHDDNDAFWELQALNRALSGVEDELPVYSTAQFDLEDDVTYAYRMYLTGLIAVGRMESDDSRQSAIEVNQAVEDTTQAIREMHKKNPDNFWIAWLLIYADADFSQRTGRTAALLRDQYVRGSRSPILYMEAWQLFEADPALLSDLGDYELQVLTFAVRHGLMTETVLSQVNYLAIRRKTFSKKLFHLLGAVYENSIGDKTAENADPALGQMNSVDAYHYRNGDETRSEGRDQVQTNEPENANDEVRGNNPISPLQLRDTLESICTMLIRGNVTDPSCFIWYQRGVEQGLSITRLLDYYMLSLPEDFEARGGKLPQMVVMYYAYQNFLPWRQSAYLYRYVCEHRDDFPEVYAQYGAAIDQFTLEQLSQHRISEDLAYLYRRYLTAGRVLGDDIASAAVPAVFVCRIRVGAADASEDRGKAAEERVNSDGSANPAGIQRIVVVGDHDAAETYCPVGNGEGFLPVYGRENVIFLEDNAGNRYAVSVPYTLTRMMDYEKLAPELAVYETSNAGYDLYLAEEGRRDLEKTLRPLKKSGTGPERTVPGGLVSRLRRLAGTQSLLPAERVKVQRELLDLYEKTDDEKELRELLSSVSLTEWSRDERNEALRAMTVLGLWSTAWGWVCRFGTEDIDADVLLRLVSGIIREGTPIENTVGADNSAGGPVGRSGGSSAESIAAGADNSTGGGIDTALSEAAHAAFVKGKYGPLLLQYLGEFWDGTTAELDAVREAILRFGLDDFSVSRRMLVQMLFTGERTQSRPALIHTCREGGLDAAFLADVLGQSSHFYFIDSAEMPDEEFNLIARYGMEGVPLLDICRIAWLSHRAEQQGEARNQSAEVTQLFLTDLLGRGVVFPFFRQFVGAVPGMEAYADVTLVEYRTGKSGRSDAGKHVLYHYAMEQNGVRDSYAAKEMKEMYDGVYVTGFLLFFGEQMHYYITDDAAEKNIVETGTVSQDARLVSADSDRFGAINEIAMLVALGRDDEALKKLDAYGRKAFVVQRLFADEKD